MVYITKKWVEYDKKFSRIKEIYIFKDKRYKKFYVTNIELNEKKIFPVVNLKEERK
jgi:hypothetical protein